MVVPDKDQDRLGGACQGHRAGDEARLAFSDRKRLTVEAGQVRLSFDAGEDKRLEAAAAVIASVLDRIDALPVLLREIEDVLTILAGERVKWLKNGA